MQTRFTESSWGWGSNVTQENREEKMTDAEKLKKVLGLLTDCNVGKLVRAGQLETEEEEFGALVALGAAFRQAWEIVKS